MEADSLCLSATIRTGGRKLTDGLWRFRGVSVCDLSLLGGLPHRGPSQSKGAAESSTPGTMGREAGGRLADGPDQALSRHRHHRTFGAAVLTPRFPLIHHRLSYSQRTNVREVKQVVLCYGK